MFIFQTAFAMRRDHGKEARWALSKRGGVQRRALSDHLISSRTPQYRHSLAAEHAKRRAEISRYNNILLPPFHNIGCFGKLNVLH
jgi:hypothetical protein